MHQKKFDFDNDPEGAVSQLIQTTIVKSGTPVSRIATELGKSEDLIYKLANPKATSQNIQLAAAIKIMKITKDYTILQEMAAEFGFRLVPVNGNLPIILKFWKELMEKLEGVE